MWPGGGAAKGIEVSGMQLNQGTTKESWVEQLHVPACLINSAFPHRHTLSWSNLNMSTAHLGGYT
jgi:hypothetical protein